VPPGHPSKARQPLSKPRRQRSERPPASTDIWLELSVLADTEAVEAVSEILSRIAPGGISVEPAFELVEEGLGARIDLTRPATVRAYLPGADRAAAEAAVERASRDLGHLQAFGLRPIGDLQTRELRETDWANAWKRHFPVLRLGRRLVIRPSWRRHRAADDEVVIALDPGMAFGTGLHPTTRLCLVGLERLADGGRLAGATVLDVGSGSGILAVTAARLGAARVFAVDIDPIAVEATTLNARRNHVARRVLAREGSLPTDVGPFDVILANLIAGLLVHLAAALYEATRPGGRVLVGGIYVDREPEVRRALAAASFHPTYRDTEGDWVALEAERID
jgi:ribosomal protein L11 methyltransferase